MFVGAYNDVDDVVAHDQGLGGIADLEEDDDLFSGERLKARFKHFVLNYRIRTAIYREQLRQHYALKKFRLDVNLAHLVAHDSDAAQKLIYEPADTFAFFEEAVMEAVRDELGLGGDDVTRIPKFQILIEAAGNTVAIRHLNSNHVGRLVFVPGIVVSASRVRAKGTELTIKCRGCQQTRTIPCSGGFGGARMPPQCLEPQQAAPDAVGVKKCPNNPYIIVADESTYVDHQTLKLQESPDSVPTGEMPRHVLLSAERYLVDQAAPGSRVMAIGIYTVGAQRKGKDSGRQSAYIRLVGLEANIDDGTALSNTVFTPEEEDEFIRMSRMPNIRDMICRSIAPAIYGHEDIKRVCACLLFGGTRKFLPDGMRLRGDINVLLLGDPGMAKSQILKFVHSVAPIGVYTSGKGSSAAGLTASVIRDSQTREFYLEGGAMVLADGGVVCIDEFDKMRLSDQVALHEAMEQQSISIAKAGLCTVLNARTSVLAAANPLFGSYDDSRSADANIEFHATILSRFDCIFLIRDRRDQQRDKVIASHVLDIHISKETDNQTEAEISVQKLKRYIAYAKARYQPILDEDAVQELQNRYVAIRSDMRRRTIAGETPPIPITVRQLEAIVRLSESLAKQELSPVATRAHVQEAIRLFRASTLDAASSGVASAENLGPEMMQEINTAENLLKRRLAIGSKVTESRMVQDFSHIGISAEATRRAISIMAQRGELEYRAKRRQIFRVR